MAKKGKSVTFKSVEDYRAYYASDTESRQTKGSKYYRIGENIAKMACEMAVNKPPKDEAESTR